jgi:hypothetical protein
MKAYTFAILDTGAEESIRSHDIATKHNCQIVRNKRPKIIVAFNGDTSTSTKIAMLGDIPANIINSAPDTLLSVASLIDKGNHTIIFDKTSSSTIISNNDNAQT